MNSIERVKQNYFECFAFGDSPEMADELLNLVLTGKKTATVSIILDDEPMPSVGDLSLVLDGRGNPACVIKTVYLETVKFCDLTWDMVKLEGEDDSFEQWRLGNIRYWTRDAAKRGYTFTDQTPVTFERFEVVENLEAAKNNNMEIKKLAVDLSVCKVEDYSQVDLSQEYCFIGKTDEEKSLVCLTENIPQNALAHDDGWKAFRIQGVLDFSLIGILSKISAVLADNKIGIFAISTYNTDYILVKAENYSKALEVLADEGYQIV